MENHLNTVSEEDFNSLYAIHEAPSDFDWKVLFQESLAHINTHQYNSSFWYIGDFSKGHIIASGGDLKHGIPKNATHLIGLSPMEIGAFIHPKDREKMMSYIMFVAQLFASKNDSERKLIKPIIIFRMLNAHMAYTWRIMSYPDHLYISNKPVLLLCQVEEVNHYVQHECKLYVHDSTTSQPKVYYCDDTKDGLRIVENAPLFSERELEILKLLAKGMISKEIGAQLNISKNTVENHKQNMFAKCAARKVTELIAFANENKLI